MLSHLKKPALVTLLAATLVACGVHMDGDRTAGNQKLKAGISLARAGIQQYQAGSTDEGLQAVDQGRGMMGQGMIMMGLGCCLQDGGAFDAGAADDCAALMGPGASMMVEGLFQFDAARPMMTAPDPADANQGMANMEAGMEMMEQGSTRMMGMSGNMGSSGMM